MGTGKLGNVFTIKKSILISMSIGTSINKYHYEFDNALNKMIIQSQIFVVERTLIRVFFTFRLIKDLFRNSF